MNSRLTDRGEPDTFGEMNSETPMKIELKQSGKRHARRLIGKLLAVVDIPEVAQDSIRQELEYATMDGYRITMKHQSEKEPDHADYENRFNR